MTLEKYIKLVQQVDDIVCEILLDADSNNETDFKSIYKLSEEVLFVIENGIYCADIEQFEDLEEYIRVKFVLKSLEIAKEYFDILENGKSEVQSSE